ncbi:hypothetical protein EMIT0158MI4_80054 [Burkholderia ambifaria]
MPQSPRHPAHPRRHCVFASLAPFRAIPALPHVFDALPKVWKSAQKMYRDRCNWIDTLHSLNQRRQPTQERIEPTRQAGNRRRLV